MRETKFIQQNKDKWRAFDQALDQEGRDPKELDELFVQVTDDLSYARTFYPNRSVRVYLNGLAQRVFTVLYRNRRSSAHRLVTFWTDELPQLVYEARGEFRFAFLVFALAMLIGMVSSASDAEFLRVILGDSYVDMTLENIDSGDPMAVYKQKGEFEMSLGITLNNLWVSFLTFVTGAFFTIGSIAVLVRNGIMLGAFQYFFIEQDLFWESFLTVWIHGTLEISAIIIAGAAGITMGKGLVFPGTYNRIQAFQKSARRGIKIMVGIAPIIILAGFIEGYLTRHTETPDAVRALFILLCLSFVLLYFVWYPRIKARVGFDQPVRDTRLTPDARSELSFTKIRSAGELFTDLFVVYKRHFGVILLTTAGAALLFTAFAFLPGDALPEDRFRFPSGVFLGLGHLAQFFNNPFAPLIPFAHVLNLSVIALLVFRKLAQEERPGYKRSVGIAFINLMPPMGALTALLYTNDWYTVFLSVLFIVIPAVWGYCSYREGLNSLAAFSKSLSLWSANFSRIFSLSLMLMLIGLLFYSLVNTVLAWFFLDLVTWVVQLDEAGMAQLSVVLLAWLSVWLLYLVGAMLLLGGGLLYYTLLEIQEAPGLRTRIAQIGQQVRIRGLEKERR
ncbi:MAG: stage II sporulation protein M [Phaeodactylibacter sp.]|uniref:stage II sporulation protein M n=1 Tax=Phaeodactylibacter sp. TaxID=1940289 RepID=UPI0032ECB687